MSQSDPTFSEFYAGYLAHHRHPWNRALHLAAKLLALAGLAAAVYERSVLLLLAAPVLAVAPCWIGHRLFEGDRPVSWTQPAASLLGSLGRICGIGGIGARQPRPPGVRPYYSFAADLRMCGAMLGRLGRPAMPTPKGNAGASSEPT
ncbi:MAG TPA: Mpo1-like protein [Thermoanaerobaculia bacterium]